MKWTNEQNIAINKKGCNLLVSAGAGSGKTAVLVERIIKKVVEDRINITDILVVTFTNLAASEMKERILNRLYELIEENPTDIFLQNQIMNMPKANIMTIHSFCFSVIKQYYYVLALDPKITIANEIDNQLMKYEVLEEMFDEEYEKEIPNEDFCTLLEIFKSKKDDDILKEVVLNIYSYLQNQPFEDLFAKKIFEQLQSSNLINFESTMYGKEYINQCIIQLNSAINMCEDCIDVLADDEKQVNFYFNVKQSFIELKDKISDNKIKWDNIVDIVINFKLDKRIALRGYDEDTKNEIEVYWKNIKKILEKIKNINYEENILLDVKKNENIINLLFYYVFEFKKRFLEKKQKHNVIDFNDIEHFALKILGTQNEDGEIIASAEAKEYKSKFKEILIDEYQDSNYVQEYILNLISTCDIGKFNIFMVGDIKQSIYKFRGAVPNIFLEKYNTYSILDENCVDSNENKCKVNLYKNFRSRKEILDFVNYIFSNIMTKEFGELQYTKDEYLNSGTSFIENINKEKNVSIDIIEKSDEIIDGNVDNQEENNYEEERNIEEQQNDISQCEIQYIANKIKQMVKSQYQIIDKKTVEYRNIKYNDIVILLRSTKGLSDMFSQVFKKENVPIYIDNSVGYLSQIEVQEVLSFLQIIDNPYQDIPLLSVLKSPFGNFNDDELVEIRKIDRQSSFFQTMQKASIINEKVRCFIDKIATYREEAKNLTVSKLIWKIYEEHKYLEYMHIFKEYENKKANLMLLFERAKQYEESSYKGLFNFIKYIEKVKDKNQDMGSAHILGENDNVVRLMSIHKSKGLEFPVVILANTNKKFNFQDLNETVLLHQQLLVGMETYDLSKSIHYSGMIKNIIKNKMKNEIIAEEMRMLYVALTRAKEKLIITGVSNNVTLDEKKAQYGGLLSVNSYMDLINYCIYNKSYDKNIVEFTTYNQTHEAFRQEEIETEEVLKEKFDSEILKIKENKFDIEKYELIEKMMNYKYENEYMTKIPYKISVSEIKKRRNDYEKLKEEVQTVNLYDSKMSLQSICENMIIKPEQKGSIYHYIFQSLDFNKSYSLEELNKHIKSIKKYSEEEIKLIDINLIYKFTSSELFERIQKADKIYKEEAFVSKISVNEIKDIYNINEKVSDNQTVMLQGIIDLFFIENNEIVIIDYKTDKITSIEEIKQKYEKQLKYYAKSLESLLNIKVKEKYIYLVNNAQCIKI